MTDGATLEVIANGQRLDPEAYPPFDGCRYEYMRGGHMLFLGLERPDRDEIELFKGKPKIGFIDTDGAIIFVIKFSDAFQSTASFSWHALTEEMRVLPVDPEPGKGALLTRVMIDNATNVVKAMHSSALSHRFTVALHAAIRRQATSKFDRAARQRALVLQGDSFTRLWARVDDACLLGAPQ